MHVCIQQRPRPGAAATRPIAKPGWPASATAWNEGSMLHRPAECVCVHGCKHPADGSARVPPAGCPCMARAQPLTNTPQHSLSHTATQKPRSGTPHTQLAHKLCVPSTRARTPSTVPLLGSGGASQSRELHWLASQRGRLGERGVGGAAAAGKKCLKLTTSFTTNTFYHPR